MQLHTNDLWVMQELEEVPLYVGDRRRKGKLILCYDYASQFVLHAQFCFLTESAHGRVYLFDALWRFGIPNAVRMELNAAKHTGWMQTAYVLGIHVITEDKDICCLDTSILKLQWKWELDSLCQKRYKNLQEFKKQIGKRINQWNQEYSSEGVPLSRAQKYDSRMQNHIFVGKDVLSQSCLFPCKGQVTDGGTIQVLHRHYEAPKDYMGKQIEFYVSITQKQEVYILDERKQTIVHRCPLVRQE